LLTSGACNSGTTTAVKVTYSLPSVAGTISGTSSLCLPNTGTTLTLSGSTGTIAWYKATVNGLPGTFSVITGQTATTLATGATSAGQVAYKATVTSGACTSASTTNFVITTGIVSKAITANTTTPSGLTSTSPLCTSGVVSKTLTLGAGYVGSIQWQRATSSTGPWTDISGATLASYTISNPTTGANYFRVKLSNGVCTPLYSTNTFVVYYASCVKSVEDEVVTTEFDAIAYPNPYDQYFTIQLTTESDENVSIAVYDMAGKLLENLTVQPSELESLQIGRDLSTGVYNVMVTQGREAKVVRLMKR